jgi:tRNA G37 N-methylase TrmD
VAKWREEQALARTKKLRPDLLKDGKGGIYDEA